MEVLTKAGVKAIGLDFIYTVSAESWLSKLNLPGSDISRNYDSPLRAQLAATSATRYGRAWPAVEADIRSAVARVELARHAAVDQPPTGPGGMGTRRGTTAGTARA